ncbi:hypothetical protein JXA56_04325 [Candidatus Micrarchaeota archaeon]|nr:hypothetical protein [Candidatus Micrarchaeota archaeon]
MIMRLVATTQNLLEANKVAEDYEMNGFKVRIIENKQGTMSVYQVFAGKHEGMA